MRAVAARAVVIALALAPTALAGCGRAAPVVSRADCEHVLAHLYVLEKDQPERPISRYHPAAGTGKDVFMARCPKVLSAREVDCYLRATSAASADDCLHRRELDRRLGGTGLPDPLAVPTTPAAPSAPPGLAIDAAVAVTPAAPPVDAAAPAPPNLVVDAAVPTAPPADAAVAPPALDAGATAAPAAAGPPTGIDACDAYAAAIERYAACPALTPSARQAALDGLAALRDGWARDRDPPDDIRAIAADGCRQAHDALRTTAATAGCPL